MASEQLKHAWFGNNMMVLEVETACAQADEKQQRGGEKGGERGMEGGGEQGGALRDSTDVLSPVCRFVSRERCCMLS